MSHNLRGHGFKEFPGDNIVVYEYKGLNKKQPKYEAMQMKWLLMVNLCLWR